MNKNIKAFLCRIIYSPIGDLLFSSVGGKAIFAKYQVYSTKKRYLAQAKKEIRKDSSFGSFDDYSQALDKHWVSYHEYSQQYEFFKKTEEERDEFVSLLKMAYFYWRYAPSSEKPLFRNKQEFLSFFKEYIHREWLFSPDVSFEVFERFLSNYDCIVKPSDEKCGHGIFKVYKGDCMNDRRSLYESCVKNKMLVEECIDQCGEIKAFHPQSLNTIRVVTVSNKEKAEVFGAVIRIGVGDSVVDNARSGGVYAQINVENGIIESDAIDIKGNRFEYHPDSGIVFKGFRIPQWDRILETCCEAAKTTTNILTGWDVVINNKGEVEFVEGNNGPGFVIMQTPLKRGVKKRLFGLIKEYSGIEMK